MKNIFFGIELIPFRVIMSYFFCSTNFQNRAVELEFALRFTTLLSLERE